MAWSWFHDRCIIKPGYSATPFLPVATHGIATKTLFKAIKKREGEAVQRETGLNNGFNHFNLRRSLSLKFRVSSKLHCGIMY